MALFLAVGAFAYESPTGKDIRWEDTGPPQGIYFYWYEPSFYMGFAPRTQEPKRLHIHLGRGNQLRITLVLGPEEIDSYLEDLQLRRSTIEELIRKKVIQLTTNKEWENFTRHLDAVKLAAQVQGRKKLGPAGYQAKSLEIMRELNPGRIFHVRFSADALLNRWRVYLAGLPRLALTDLEAKIDAVNELLPGRVNLYQLLPDDDKALIHLYELARASDKDAASLASFQTEALAFLTKVTRGLYPVEGGVIDVYEFTAIYPAGTVQEFTKYKGKKIPHFGVTGVWSLIERDKGRGMTGFVDYLSTNPAYGFITMLPYEDAGGIVYNAFHNAGVRCPMGGTSFLPKAWLKAEGTREKKNYQNLWICSRGPVSHGCTRLGSGHMSEMRHILPSDSDKLLGLPTFRNLAYTYDIFDIDADGMPEVMGVKYYLAYSTTKDRLPYKAWASNQRKPFYEWLYAGELSYKADGSGYFKEAPSCRFVRRAPQEAKTYKDIPLYEAEWEPEHIQFYKLLPTGFDSPRGFEFNRELRRLAFGYSIDRKDLFLK